MEKADTNENTEHDSTCGVFNGLNYRSILSSLIPVHFQNVKRQTLDRSMNPYILQLFYSFGKRD